MKKIDFLGKRLYVLTDKEIRDPDDFPLYCIDPDAYCKIYEALREFALLLEQSTLSDCGKTCMMNMCSEAYEGLCRGRSILRL